MAHIVKNTLFASLVFGATFGVSAEELVFLYEDHPPFTYEEDGKVAGIFAPVTEEAVKFAGFDISWQKQSFNRIKRALSASSEPFCVTGHSLGQDSDSRRYVKPAIGHFGQSGILVREDDKHRFEKIPSIRFLFEKTPFVGAFIKGAIYAVPHTEYLERSHSNHLMTASNHEQLAQLVARARVDFIIENELMLPIHQKLNVDGEPLAFVALPDMPEARAAYIVCTKAVSALQIKRLSAGISEATKKAAQK